MFFRNEETRIQVAGINYLKAKYPWALYTIAPNGVKLPIYAAKMFKAMGYVAGTPDIMLFEPAMYEGKHYCGSFIEVKTEEGRLQPNQTAFLKNLDAKGYKTFVCYGYIALVEALDSYLSQAHVLKCHTNCLA